jgi:hypothetical protein
VFLLFALAAVAVVVVDMPLAAAAVGWAGRIILLSCRGKATLSWSAQVAQLLPTPVISGLLHTAPLEEIVFLSTPQP